MEQKVPHKKMSGQSLFGHEYGRYEMHPRRDWVALLIGTLCFIVILLIVGIVLNYTYSPQNIVANDSGVVRAKGGNINMTKLDRVLKEYESKKTESEDLLTTSTVLIQDPSR